MAQGKEWQRSPDGFRFQFGGINTMVPPDQLPETKYPYASNIRRRSDREVTSRPVEDDPIYTLPSNVHSIRRLNDTTPAGPPSGFALIEGAGGALFCNATQVNIGLSGNPISLVPFRPNQSVQPWMYTADSNKMLKVRSDGLCYAMGIAEPQTAPNVQSNVAATVISTLGDVTTYYYGDSPHSGPVGKYIWRNPTDTGASGPERSISQAAGNTTGSSLLFDKNHVAPAGTKDEPMQWEILDDTGASLGTFSLFEPALESEGYADFNLTVLASLYVPAAGAYTFAAAYKDQIMWGIGDSAAGSPSWPSKGSLRGPANQTKTVINGSDLLPAPSSNDGGGYTGTSSVVVTFPAAGIYPIEIDYDYWYHSNRHLTVTVNGADIPPIPGDVFKNAQYRYTYRSSATGAVSNPSPASTALSLPVASTDLTAVPSTDPQVDKIDWYRLDLGLLTWTYVGTSPNTTVPFTDALLDTDVENNPTLEFDNYQPFPSIDLPKAGVVNIAAGVVEQTLDVTWVSGNQFSVRWLPGTVIVLGTVAYTLYNRPTSATHLTVVLIGTAPTALTNQPYEIAQPILAAQPMPSMWGPTDNVSFMFACGDPLRPGTLYWTKGNNPDSAPQTNTSEVTSPSEPLMNGTITNGIGMVFSTERAWLIYPNFFNAQATASGTVGSTWTLQESITNRGLYIRNCVCSDGGKDVFFRGKDGIYVSPGGVGAQSITDDDLWNIFPHEGFKPVPITRAGYTIWPPDDTKPESQCLRVANGYMYYDYLDVNSIPRTLVFDIAAKGWVVDVYGIPVTTHVLEEGFNINGTLVGCTDGTVRPLVSGAEAAATTHVPPPLQGPMGLESMNAGFFDESTRTLYWGQRTSGTVGYINEFNPVTGLSQHLIPDLGHTIPFIVAGSQALAEKNGVVYYATEGNTGSGALTAYDTNTDSVLWTFGGGLVSPYAPAYSMAIVTIAAADYILLNDLNRGASLTRASDGAVMWGGQYLVGSANQVLATPSGVMWFVSNGHIAKIDSGTTNPPTVTDYVVPDATYGYVGTSSTTFCGALFDPVSNCIIYATSSGAIVKWSTITHSEVSRNSAAGIQTLRQLTSSGLILSCTGDVLDHDKVRIFKASDLALLAEYSLSALGLPVSVSGPLAGTPNTVWFGRFYDEAGPGIMLSDNNQQVWYVPIPVPPFSENADCVLLTQAVNAGDTRADKRVGDIFLRANISPTGPVTVQPYSSIYTNALSGYSPTALSAATEAYQPFIVDFVDGLSRTVDDIEAIFTWTVGQTTYLSLWQPNFILRPEATRDRPTDFTDGGFPGTKFVQGIRLEADTFGQNKVFVVQNGDDQSFVVPNESPCNFNGQSIQTFSFSPFLAHTMRVVSTDGVPWEKWGVEYIFQPYPEECTEWTSELMNYGDGWQHIRMLNIAYIATAPITITLNFDQWPQIVLNDELPPSPSQLLPIKTKVNVPANKTKLMGISLTSTEPFRLFKDMMEVLVGDWGRTDGYRTVMPAGGPARDGAEA